MFQQRFFALFLGLFILTSTIAIPSSEAILPENLPGVSQAPYHVQVIEHGNYIAYLSPLYTTYGDPSSYLTGNVANGVGKLMLVTTQGTFGCTGTLLDPTHVLTAAHCISDSSGNNILTGGNISLINNNGQIVTSNIVSSVKHPNYDGKFTKGNDVAVLTIQAISNVPTHSIKTLDSSLTGISFDKYGYGISGTGATGTNSQSYPFGTERNVKNSYDDYADTMMQALGEPFVSHSVLQYDFDNGNSANDAFGFFFQKYDTSTNNGKEGLSAPGDSGGPTFDSIGNIVGITSYGITLTLTNGNTSDITKQGGQAKLDSSFGEFGADTNVAFYSSWISAQLGTSSGGNNPPSNPIADHAYVSYSINKGVVKVMVDLRDKNNLPVPNTGVTIIFASPTFSSGETTKSTNVSGIATWNFKGVPGGDYKTTITKINGQSWNGITYDPGFHK